MNKIRRWFYLYADEIKYIDQVREKHGLDNLSDAMRVILQEHRSGQNQDAANLLAQSVADKVTETIDPVLRKILAGVNHTDRETAVSQLLLNTLTSYSGMRTLISSDTPQLIEAREEISRRISAAQTSAAFKNSLRGK